VSGSGLPGSPPGAERPDLGIAGARYGRYVVILAAILLVAFTIHVALTSHKGATGIRPGARIPPFAAPYAIGGPAGEVDVATHPNEGRAGKVPACSERGPAILNICQLYERGPVVLALFFDAGSCTKTLEDLQRIVSEFPEVGFAAVAVKEDAASVARIVRSKRLTMPVGVDTDGRLGELYAMVSCPQITFVYPGGVVQSPALLSRPPLASLRARIAALLAASRARGWRPARAGGRA
jgi:AhpC/TSA family